MVKEKKDDTIVNRLLALASEEAELNQAGTSLVDTYDVESGDCACCCMTLGGGGSTNSC
jgi:hypothetical protein